MRRGTAPRWSRRAALAVAATAAAVLGPSGALVLGSAPAGATAPPTLVCGTLPTTDVVLAADLTCDTGFYFPQGDPGVDIDLNGHTLTVAGEAGRCGVAPGPCGAIAGAKAVHFGSVVGSLSDIDEVSHVFVRGDIEARLGFAGDGGAASVHDTFVLDGRIGVWGPSVEIRRSVLRGGIAVLDVNQAVRDLVVEGNWILQAPGDGVSIAPPFADFPDDVTGSISHNVIWGAAGDGIDIGGEGIWNVGALTVEHNLLVGNGGSGFRSGITAALPPGVGGGPITLTDNVALFNKGHGIDAGWSSGTPGVTGIVDGGGNRAALNATSPQCVGVTCC